MTEHYSGEEAISNPPKRVCFGVDPYNDKFISVGDLYDIEGQVVVPSKLAIGNGGIISSQGLPNEQDFDRVGRVLVTTSEGTYWIENGVIVDVNGSLHMGSLKATRIYDSDARIRIDDEWRYKPGEVGGVDTWIGIKKVKEIAIDAKKHRFDQTVAQHEREGTLYTGFDDVQRRLAAVGINPSLATLRIPE